MKQTAFPSGKEEKGNSAQGLVKESTPHTRPSTSWCQALAGHWRDSSAKRVLTELAWWADVAQELQK